MTTKAQFKEALKRLLGEQEFQDLERAGYSTSALCTEVATRYFLDKLHPSTTLDVDVAIVQMVALRLWYGDGTHGLSE